MKKVLMFVVEGSTEESALSPILKKLFQDTGIVFRVMRGDITADWNRSDKIVNEMNDQIKNEMKRYSYRKSDMLKVFHIIDTDGAFIPDAFVLSDSNASVTYTEEEILCPCVSSILERNKRKREAVLILKSKSVIGGIPYQMLYFSRNMEHVLYDHIGVLEQKDKIKLADDFADRFSEDVEGFKQFISSDIFAVRGNYKETWKFIMDDKNSLKRYCNLHLILKDGDIEKELGEQ